MAIVEDDENTREVFRTILEHAGHRVVEASNGEEGLSMVRANRPDLILLDLGLPGLDGRAVAEALKADPRTASVPIIVVTAATGGDTRSWALHTGCNAILEKPVPLRLLTATVERWVHPAA